MFVSAGEAAAVDPGALCWVVLAGAVSGESCLKLSAVIPLRFRKAGETQTRQLAEPTSSQLIP
jgi:hypothetical protein